MFAMFMAYVKGVITHHEEIKTLQISPAGRKHQKSCTLVVVVTDRDKKQTS